MTWLLWAVLLIVQNFAFTIVSRARNSNSLKYHAIASVFSNGVWFVSTVILVDSITEVLRTADWTAAVGIGAFYTVCTMTGSLTSHWVAMKFFEVARQDIKQRRGRE